MSKPNQHLQRYWRSLDVKRRSRRLNVLGNAAGGQAGQGEFAPGADELAIEPGPSRRKFMGILGASTAIAGLTGTGCIRKPREYIVPFAKRPEEVIPGEPLQYASAVQIGGTVMGVLVECHDGRPVKIEGNPEHSNSQGNTDVWTQASVLELYDPDRSRTPRSFVAQVHYTYDPSDKAAQNTKEFVQDVARQSLCTFAYDRTLSESKSVDRAREVQAKCEELASSDAARWDIKRVEGNWQATLSVTGDEQIESDWNSAWQGLDGLMAELRAKEGKGAAVVVGNILSPTLRDEVRRLMASMPQAKLVVHDPASPMASYKTAQTLCGEHGRFFYDLRGASVILAADSDFLGVESDHVRLTREFMLHRKVAAPSDIRKKAPMSRLYAMEAHPSITGIAADHRLQAKSSHIVDLLSGIAIRLMDKHKRTPTDVSLTFARVLKTPKFSPETEKWLDVVADELADASNKQRRSNHAVVVVGERQPPAAQAVGLLINDLIGATATLRSEDEQIVQPAINYRIDLDSIDGLGIDALAKGLADKSITHVLCLGTNPVYEAPGSLGLEALMTTAPFVFHAGMHVDETAVMATWHMPTSHALESWGDLEASNGVISIVQPVIDPLFGTPSLLEVVGRMNRPGAPTNGRTLVKEYWASQVPTEVSERTFEMWLHDGIVTAVARSGVIPANDGWGAFSKAYSALPRIDQEIEINFHIDYSTYGGRFANNAWMQECPHPVSKLTWDNAAYIAPALATRLGVKNGDMLAIKTAAGSAAVPAWIVPGQVDDTVSLTLGQGRRGMGEVAQGAGYDAYKLQVAESPHMVAGTVSRGAGNYLLVSTQDYGSLDPDGPDGTPLGINFEERPLIREATVDEYVKNPDFAKEGDLMPETRLHSLFENPELTGLQQWGLVFDLNNCTGCNACIVACQAENNIPVVGKTEVANGRELHWIRLDRYFRGDEHNPHTVFQPVGCQHCEHAPCETVCPVAATPHSPEGLNDMAYNRCIGTRYCSNNCPYKVRRFNYFNYNYDLDPIEMMQKNPDVTVRFRGVMEKCSYCVQRINEAKIEAHVRGEDTVADGAIVTACQQVCPGEAITFGDVKDPKTKVSKLKESNRNYALLADLKTKPRTSYLGRVLNPNPKLKDA